MILNVRAVDRNIDLIGVDITLYHYPNMRTPSYNSSTQSPSLGTPSITTPRTIITEPRNSEIQNSGGLIDMFFKKMSVGNDCAAEKGDMIVYGTNKYRVIAVNPLMMKKELFVKNINEEEYLG